MDKPEKLTKLDLMRKRISNPKPKVSNYKNGWYNPPPNEWNKPVKEEKSPHLTKTKLISITEKAELNNFGIYHEIFEYCLEQVSLLIHKCGDDEQITLPYLTKSFGEPKHNEIVTEIQVLNSLSGTPLSDIHYI